jgi:hypothetical protein
MQALLIRRRTQSKLLEVVWDVVELPTGEEVVQLGSKRLPVRGFSAQPEPKGHSAKQSVIEETSPCASVFIDRHNWLDYVLFPALVFFPSLTGFALMRMQRDRTMEGEVR